MALMQSLRSNRMLPGLLTVIMAIAAAAESSLMNASTAFVCPMLNVTGFCSCSGHAVNCDALGASDLSFIAPSASAIKTLSAAHNDIRALPADFLLGAVRLTKLSLSHNKIASIETSFLESLPFLIFLDLSFNELKTFYLPGNALPSLRFLNLTNNFLVNLRFDAHRPNEQFSLLRLNGNNISDLNDAFHYNGLDQLFLAHNKIGNNLSFLRNLTKLRKVSLGYNNISEIPSTVFPCREYPKILYLNNNKINNLEFLKCTTFLLELDVSSNIITEIPDNTFAELILLDTLSIADNQITDSYFLKKISNIIKDLDLSRNKLPAIHGDHWINKTKLKYLDVSHNDLKDIKFAGFLENLEEFLANNNKISNIEGTLFLRRGSKKSAISNLGLSNNFISDVTFLLYLTNIVNLNMSNNNILSISDEAVSQLKQLVKLDLTNNRINDVRFLHKLSSLISLRLSNNNVMNLPCNHNIQRIHLDGNNVTNLQLDCTPNLRYLSVYGCDLRDRKEQDLRTSREVLLSIRNQTITFDCFPPVNILKKCQVMCDSSDAKSLVCEQQSTMFINPIAIVIYSFCVPVCLLSIVFTVAKCKMRRRKHQNKKCLCIMSENVLINEPTKSNERRW